MLGLGNEAKDEAKLIKVNLATALTVHFHPDGSQSVDIQA